MRGFGHKHQYTMATGVASHHSQVPCLGLVDLFGGRLETWECEGTQYRCSSDSALSHPNARVYSCWEAAVHRDRLAAPEGFFFFPKDRFPHPCHYGSPPDGVAEPGKWWVRDPISLRVSPLSLFARRGFRESSR